MAFKPTRDQKLRWVDYARRSMQRIGFLKLVVAIASPARGQTLEALTKTFAAAVTKGVPVPEAQRDSFEQYIRPLRTRYSSRADKAEIQDLYLSDPSAPSSSGAITGDIKHSGYRHAVYVEIPTWAARLKLIRDQNYTLTDRGRVLALLDQSTLQKFSRPGPNNPFILSPSERYVALFCLLDVDGDFLRTMYEFLQAKDSFSRNDAGDAALQALIKLRGDCVGSSDLQKAVRAKLERAIKSIEKQKDQGLGPKESIATPRIEPLVDCGLLLRPTAGKYEYTFTSLGRTFIDALASTPSISEFIEHHLSGTFARHTDQTVSLSEPKLENILNAYGELRSGLGYVSLRELSVLSIARLVGNYGSSLFEIGAIEAFLKQAAGKNSQQVRVAVGRGGGIAQVRINPRAFDAARG